MVAVASRVVPCATAKAGMYLFRTYKTCSYCGTVSGYFYARMKLRKTGKRSICVTSKCKICHREDENLRQMRLYYKDKKSYIDRRKEWRIKNRKKYNFSQRIWYRKKQLKSMGAIYGDQVSV
jgi:hypothetical protein